MRYKKLPMPARIEPALLKPREVEASLLGMLYLVEVNITDKTTREVTKHKLLLVGCEVEDIERKMRWIFDTGNVAIVIKGIEKVREKVHYLSTVITRTDYNDGPVVMRDENSQDIKQFTPQLTEPYDPKLFAVGITTTMLAKDSDHALRKVATAIMSRASPGKSHSGASLHEDSTIVIEEVPKSSGYAMVRDVSNEANRAHVVRG